MTVPPSNLSTFESLLKIIEALRGPDGCPWDKEQTHRTLTPYAIEEAHELVEAIESGDQKEVIGELGDVLLQVVLHAEIARQAGEFTIDDVIRTISEKMVRRHPHVFANSTSNSTATTSSDVVKNWAEIKAAEKSKKPSEDRFDIPRSLPALQRSQKIGAKTQQVGFDWPDSQGVLDKLDEEIAEVKAEISKLKPGSRPSAQLEHALEHEIGDVLFSAAQLARHLGLEAEQCLRTANARFEKRYFTMRDRVTQSGRNWAALSDPEKEAAWQEAKRSLS